MRRSSPISATAVSAEIAGYRIIGQLCSEPAFRVFRAQSPEGEFVLLKVAADPASSRADRLRQEYQRLQTAGFSGVARTLALIDQQGCVAMVLSDFAGETLEALLNHQRLDVTAGLAIGCALTAVLADLHAAGVILRDIRPSRILVAPVADSWAVCLIDFSLATVGISSAPDQYELDDDLSYLSPERTGRMNRPVDYRTDFYSLGIVLYEMLAGQLPFEASDALEWVHCHVARVPRPLHEAVRSVPRTLSDIVMKLLAKVAEDRYQSAHGLRYDLERCRTQWNAGTYIMPFPLGTHDASDRFHIPLKLYGREAEAAVLSREFDRMCASGQPALVSVSGYAGIGKTALVRELYKPVMREQGYFICGKADQYKRDMPYAMIIEALYDLVRQILGESEARVTEWKTQLETVLGGHGRLVVDVIPQLELIIGPQPEVPPLPAIETQNRFNQVFRRFIGLFATHAHPLVVFLDDVQWADAAGIALLRHLLTHSETRYLMLVAAYRENEVATHTLEPVLDALRHAGDWQEIHLSPLQVDSLAELIADTLRCTQADAMPLALLLQRKTDGNPLFVNQFLRTLHRDGLIFFDKDAACWRWDIARIQAADVTDNVVELMASQIGSLANSSRDVLRLAVCLGHRFDLTMLAQLAGRTPSDAAHQLEPVVEQGFFVETLTPAEASGRRHSYRWSHDRVQQAAYSLIDERERAKTHLQIGRMLLRATLEAPPATGIFEIVNHLNRGVALITDEFERNWLAELNLTAAGRAKRTAAFAAARDYAAAGVALLKQDAWRDQYSLAMSLHLELIEASFSCGAPADADALIEKSIPLAASDADRGRLLQLRVSFATSQSNDAVAVRTALEALRLFGVNLPVDREGWAAALPPAMGRVEAALQTIRLEDLLERPAATDPLRIAGDEMIGKLMVAANSLDPRLFALLVVTLVERSLQHGHTEVSARAGYGGYGVFIYQSRGDFERGYRFFQLARGIAEKMQNPILTAKVDSLGSVFFDDRRKPLQAVVETFMKSYATELEYGDLHYAVYNLLMGCSLRLARGEHLDMLADELARAQDFAGQSANDVAFRSLQSYRRLVGVLRGEPSDLATPAPIDEALSRLEGQTDLASRHAHMAEMDRLVFFGAFGDAMRLAQRAGAETIAAGQPYLKTKSRFYWALANAATCDTRDQAVREKTISLLQACQTELAPAVTDFPGNFVHYALLLAAETARLSGDQAAAFERYDSAIAAAADSGFVHIQALAAERAASACEPNGASAKAAVYLNAARVAYTAWGAHAKVRQLDAKLTLPRKPLPNVQGFMSGDGPTQLDVLSIVKASQAVSGEIVLEKLLDTLMRVVIENAGAQKGCLILHTEAGWSLAAEARVEAQDVIVNLPQEQGVPPALLPASIVNYVRRSREKVLLTDATEANQFSADPYLQQQCPKSLLCLPILRQAALVGLLYLEHGLVTHAFTPDRLAMLALLASQAAISLENAQLYKELREREARIGRLVESNVIGIVFGDGKGNIVEANDAFLTIVGYTREDLRLGKIRWADMIPPEYDAIVAKASQEIVRAGRCAPYEQEYIAKDGRRVPVLIGAAALGNQQALAFVLDLTERKQGEAERAARKAAEEANEAKSVFLANMSHELRSPLNTLLGFARLMERHPGLPPDVKQDLAVMLESGEHLRKLINQLLDLGKIEAGRMMLNLGNVDLNDLLGGLRHSFNLKARDKGLSLLFECTGAPRIVRADAVKLRQVLTNLVGNAMKFTSHGSVLLRIARVTGQGGDRLMFTVEDTGVGIGAEELANLFQPFSQAYAGRQAKEGTGLGLTISRSLLQLMGGDIHIESEPGKGTVVAFDIPVEVIDSKAITASPFMAKRRVVGLDPEQERYRVLVVDDNEEARRWLTRLLSPLGFEVRAAANGQEAVDIWELWRPRLIWMDMRMPVMDGAEATRRIRASAEGQSATIIALTASSIGEEPAQIIDAGCNDLLHKPVLEEELFAAMEKHMGARFIFEAEEPSPPPAVSERVQSGALQALPAALRESLEQALVQLDHEAVVNAVGQVDDAQVAKALGVLANDFQYDSILQLLRKGSP